MRNVNKQKLFNPWLFINPVLTAALKDKKPSF